ncbi:MAG: hypothetical protein LUH09_10780 [Clostridiales bacterium]|nr:hypothetical protein [Clostridiales bacterium]
MNDNELRRAGREEASSWMTRGTLSGCLLARQIRDDLAALEAVCRRLETVEGGEPARAWLLDNRYLARQTAELRRTVGRKRLPALQREERQLRLLRVGEALAGLTPLTPEGLTAFLSGIQEVEPLTESELALLPQALGAGLLHSLRSCAEQLEELIRQREPTDALERPLRDLVVSLRALHQGELLPELEPLSMVDGIFRQDPSGVYPNMTADSRQDYRAALCRLAKQRGMSEMACARQLLDLARQGTERGDHIGAYLFPQEEQRRERTRGGWYIGGVLGATTALALWLSMRLGTWWSALLLWLPLSELVKNGADFLLLRLVPPRPVFRMELRHGVPREGRTLCVIAALLTGETAVDKLLQKLERYALANCTAGEQVTYGLLADLPDRDRPVDDSDRALTARATAGIEALNCRYQGQFCLLFREPVLEKRENRYRGRERKRGAVLDAVRFLRGRRCELELLAGGRERLTGVQYLLVLDSDTVLTMEAVNEMVGAALHPLNVPRIDRERRVVTAGYGILQPRVETELSPRPASVFARLFGGLAGLDPYGGAVSDLYHDLFDQASFLGKGLLHVEAFGICMDGRFPRGQILSHDLLEGSYLRTGWVSRTELMDSFPERVSSWLERSHRWIRGDWQLLSRLGRRVKNEAGEWEENPISPVAKWKLADNLRRSLVPPATLLSLLLGLFFGGRLFLWAAAIALLSFATRPLTAVADLLWRRGRGSFRRYHSGVYSGVSGELLRTAAQLLLLPVQSWTALSAVILALWRSYVSRRHLLDWVTSDQSGSRNGGPVRWLIRFWPAEAAGLAALLSGRLSGLILGAAWLISPLLFARWSRRPEYAKPLSEPDRAFLLHEGALIWRYFDRWLRPEYHWLIPDNVQALPDTGAALRTSPTNLGLALLSCLAAVDLGLTSPRRALELIERQLNALERLERWHGHFYNWYDIETAAPLSPRYVSTVDSGNLCADLIALEAGLEDLGRPDLADRAAALAGEMDFSLLFDARCNLFFIGYSEESRAYDRGHYDLMASEARLTSYLAVARGDVPPRHWRRLSRAVARANGYTGMVSWSGTMFEYLMPQLLLPCCQDSLLSETLTFCVDQQRRFARRHGIPWGISESAFYALDGAQVYQYKAHGVPVLGLCRSRPGELVAAPYAAFLALMVEPRQATADLRRFRSLGAEGQYGLYEALDYTASRGGTRNSPLMVQNWMAHHLGMSLLALDNALEGQPMVRRFFRDARMSAARELLQERIPVGAEPVRRPVWEEHTSHIQRTPRPWSRRGSGLEQSDPVWGLLSNGGYTVLLSAGGQGASRSGESTLLHPEGIQVQVVTEKGVLTAFPRTSGDGGLAWSFRAGRAELHLQTDRFTVSQTVVVDRLRNGEGRTFTLTARQSMAGTLKIFLRPVLDRWDSYAAHPAFSRMCVESEYIGSGVRFTRREGRDTPQPVLTVLWDRPEAGWTTNRERYLTSGTLSHTGREGTVLDPCLALELPFDLRAGEMVSLRLAVAAGDREDSLLTAQGILALRRPTPSPLLDRLSQEMEREAVTAAFVLLARLQSPGPLGREGRVEGQQSLWPFGISGDLPIVTCLVQENALEPGLTLIAQHRLLSRLGYAFDLALLLSESGDYQKPLKSLVSCRLEESGGRLGQKGGIHLISGPEERWEPILGMAHLNLHPGDKLAQPERFSGRPPCWERPAALTQPPQWHWEEHAFVLETGGGLLPLRWSHPLVSDRFGWRGDEAGTGHLWYQNAQMGQLTPWQNDPIATTGPEDILLSWSGGRASLFARRDGRKTAVIYGPGHAVWRKELEGRTTTITAFVPPDTAQRLFLVETEGASPEDLLIWRFTPKLSHRDSQMPWVQVSEGEGCLRLTNPAGTMPGRTLLLSAQPGFTGWRWAEGVLELTLPADRTVVLSAGMNGDRMLPSLSPEVVRQALERTIAWWLQKTAALTVRTPEPALNHYLSFWGPYQVLAGRLYGRNGLYQCGGAYGFRDQIQDALALIPFAPELVREQLRRAAGCQFREGDVLHWWHGSSDGSARGVRTRISDDLLWLPYALGRFTVETGERTLMNVQVPYLDGQPLNADEKERYDLYRPSDSTDSLYGHGVQAVECVLNRGLGSHGLCLMGTGDWNDGMNRMGAGGRGESVWLTWFLALTLRTFAPLCRLNGDAQRGERYERLADALCQSADRAWDGEWYLRGYDDEGRPVGSHENRECAIDSLSQSFSVLAGGPDPTRSHRAVLAADDRLHDRTHCLIKLLDPPFRGETDPGYIRSYPPGLRENGGQYTHAACWLAMALLRVGERERGTELLLDLLPEGHPHEVYLGEPYVLAGDVYTAPGQEGRCGWSWYTGAAGWYCQGAVGDLLGLRLREGLLYLEPNLPEHWPGYEATWRGEGFTLDIRVVQGGVPAGLTLDRMPVEGGISLKTLRGSHEIYLALAQPSKNSGEKRETDV